jgi:4-amino-4-deoxy-L-arabinose transferase-like glycosyltransferase
LSNITFHTEGAPHLSRRNESQIALLFITAFLLLFFLQGWFFIRANSQTVDEAAHLAAGYSYLVTGDFRLDSEHPPLLKAFQALPLLLFLRLPFNPDPQLWLEKDAFGIGYEWLYKSGVSADRLLFFSRLANLSLGVFLIALMGWWAYRLWGGWAASLAAALGSLEPNFVAHSGLVTTDIGVTLFILLTVYLLWEYVSRPSWPLLLATGLAFGLALLSKFSALILLPIIFCILSALILSGEDVHFLPPGANTANIRKNILAAAVLFALVLVIAAFTIPLGYAVKGFKTWISGLELLWSLNKDGRQSFFLGDYSREGWWNYFIVAFLIKTPIGTLLLIIASLILYRAGKPLSRGDSFFLFLPPLVIFLLTTRAKINLGLRHVLPVYPFLFLLASRLATFIPTRRGLMISAISGALLFTAGSVLRIAPHQLAYFNEFVGGPDHGYRYLSDSNLDWGQDLKGLKAYMVKEKLEIIYLSYFGSASPSYYGIRYQYAPGSWLWDWPPPREKISRLARRDVLAISVYNLQDVASPDDPLFRWLWKDAPIAKIGYSIFVYDLTEHPDDLRRLNETYRKAGIPLPP